ncbi:MAG: ATP-binding cassette domain-containing protein [Pseudochelatococcus sp.]|jgi:urea transport system ATP-binding protein|uniref:ATP-binding cassette domain-containing protein n=1 Tax=Pseudochelatococcus sp. TaxID=2020869 RepID=UPI003D8D126D
MLSLHRIDSYYGRSHTLHGVSLAVERGGFLAVLGRNSVGKTTLLKSIMGLTDRVTGSIRMDGAEIVSFETHRRARAGIGYVPQGREIIPDFTVRENIIMGGFAGAAPGNRPPPLVSELFPYIVENLDRKGVFLSGGQQQQLAISRALAANPRLLLLDEPTEGIQPNIVEQIENAIITLNRKFGITTVLVDQNIQFARRAARTFAILEKGQVVAQGPIHQLTDELVHRHMAI